MEEARVCQGYSIGAIHGQMGGQPEIGHMKHVNSKTNGMDA